MTPELYSLTHALLLYLALIICITMEVSALIQMYLDWRERRRHEALIARILMIHHG